MLQQSWIRLWPLDVTLRLSLNLTGDDETNFPHRVLLTDSQVASLRKAFAIGKARPIRKGAPNAAENEKKDKEADFSVSY